MSENPVVWIGSFAGYASVGYLIYKQLWKDKPRFDFEIKNTYWYPPEKQFSSIQYTIAINTLLRNRGERNTVIHTVSISFEYEGKPYSVVAVEPSEIIMTAGDSKSQRFNFNISEKEITITNDLKNVKLKIEHTHKSKVKNIESIQRLPPRFI